MQFFRLWVCAGLALAGAAHAQWTLQESYTEASLRGIDSVGNGVAWASGTNGTVLLTEDGGLHWRKCAVPPGAEALDFRGVQAFDAKTAIVMSSGKGDLSRLYKTMDGCQTWKLLFTNPDQDGFWDSYKLAANARTGVLLGDPVNGHLAIWQVDRDDPDDRAASNRSSRTPKTVEGEAAFAASNSVIFVNNAFWDFRIATGGISGSRLIRCDRKSYAYSSIPVGTHTASSGVFSLSFRSDYPRNTAWNKMATGIAAGGDYLKPDEANAVAAFTNDSGKSWRSSNTQPHGYRSSVTYDAASKTWITVGPNGTDISTDDGRNWRALKPSLSDAPDADQHWNALSLPFVVGSKGRIGVLRGDALAKSASQ